jgi:hypothetical protein
MVAAEAQLRGATTVSRFVYLRSRWIMRSEAMPLPPSDFTSRVSFACGPAASRMSCIASTSLSQTEPLVDVQ